MGEVQAERRIRYIVRTRFIQLLGGVAGGRFKVPG
jgi:hypothetical protein